MTGDNIISNQVEIDTSSVSKIFKYIKNKTESANLNSGNGRYWIGVYRDDEFKWMWVTGEKWEYTNWDNGEPNNSGAVKPNETKITLWSGNRWNDLNEENLSEQSGYICEWD